MNFILKFWLWIQDTQLDVPLQFFGSIFCVVASYLIISKKCKVTDKASVTFMGLYAFCISESLIIVRKVIQFFIDFFVGSNLMQTQSVADEHWFFRVFGFAMSPVEQRPVMDMGEDFLLGTLGTLLATIGLFVYIGKKTKKVRSKEKITLSQRIKSFPDRCISKFYVEKHKLTQQTNLADMLLWWCVRALMIHAFVTMENRAEAVLLFVNFLGTVAISILHMFARSDSFLGRINYRVQSLLTIMVFWGSYGGNYIFLYSYIDRFDKKLHFLSGIICVLAAYYLASEFIDKKTKGGRTLIGLFAAVFSMMIVPVHEMTEFVGDFLWGTVNQGYCWIPEADSTFYRIFGLGAENIGLNSVFDTINDGLFAVTSTIVTMIPLSVYLFISKKREKKETGKTESEKNTVTC